MLGWFELVPGADLEGDGRDLVVAISNTEEDRGAEFLGVDAKVCTLMLFEDEAEEEERLDLQARLGTLRGMGLEIRGRGHVRQVW